MKYNTCCHQMNLVPKFQLKIRVTMSANNSVKYKLDLKTPVALTAVQKARLKAVAAMPDDEIDYSDIPKCIGSAPHKQKSNP